MSTAQMTTSSLHKPHGFEIGKAMKSFARLFTLGCGRKQKEVDDAPPASAPAQTRPTSHTAQQSARPVSTAHPAQPAQSRPVPHAALHAMMDPTWTESSTAPIGHAQATATYAATSSATRSSNIPSSYLSSADRWIADSARLKKDQNTATQNASFYAQAAAKLGAAGTTEKANADGWTAEANRLGTLQSTAMQNAFTFAQYGAILGVNGCVNKVIQVFEAGYTPASLETSIVSSESSSHHDTRLGQVGPNDALFWRQVKEYMEGKRGSNPPSPFMARYSNGTKAPAYEIAGKFIHEVRKIIDPNAPLSDTVIQQFGTAFNQAVKTRSLEPLARLKESLDALRAGRTNVTM